MSLWQELKKRKVIRVGVAYIIVAWLLVQVADIFFPALKLPEWTITLVAGMVILGFPLALILAWAYDLTPHDVQKTSGHQESALAPASSSNKLNYAILALLVIVVSLLLLDRFVMGEATPRSGEVEIYSQNGHSVMAGVIPLPDSAPLASGIAAIGFDGPLIALSPDDRWLVYVGRSQSGSQLYLRDLRTFEAPVAVEGTEGAINAFFSPDSASIGFVTDDKLKRVPLDGQGIHTIAATTAPVRGIWPDEDTIFVIDEQGNAVRHVEVSTGKTRQLMLSTKFRFSDVIDGGKYALAVRFPSSINGDQANLHIVDLEKEESRPIGAFGYDARLLNTGHLLFSRHGSLQIVEFDPEGLEVNGKPRPIQGDIALDSLFYQAQLAISPSGVLAYVPGTDRGLGRMVRTDRQETQEVVTSQALKYGVFDLSHDDQKLAIHVGDVTDYVWVFDLQRQQGRKLPGSDGFGWPKLSRADNLVTASLERTVSTVLRLGSLATSADERSIELPDLFVYGADWSADESTFAITEWQRGGRIGRIPVESEPKVEWFEGHDGDWGAVYSPDGNWLAYSSPQTGRYEIWIRPADGSGRPQQISVNGGIEVVWCPCGDVFYRRGDEIWSSTVVVEGTPEIGAESHAFTMQDFLDTPGRSYDVSSDGQLLYYVQLAEPAIDDRVHIITNIFEKGKATDDID